MALKFQIGTGFDLNYAKHDYNAKIAAANFCTKDQRC